MNLYKQLLPPVLYAALRKSKFRRYGWFGDFHSWDDAEKSATGYNSEQVFEKVRAASLKVKRGQAAFERDSVLFEKPEIDWPIAGALTWIAAQNDGNLNVLDFGGAFGSTFYQNKKILRALPGLKWNIIEQPHFVDTGKTLFEDGQLRFYYTINQCLNENKINVALLSSVLPYLKDPFHLLAEIERFRFVIIDKMPLVDSAHDRITIQKVPPKIYRASYPAWFFSEKRFRTFILKNFDIISEFNRDIEANFDASFKGFILRRKE